MLIFGLCHGLGLATKLMSLSISPDGLIFNLLSFNLGIELGQILVLLFVVSLLNAWRTRRNFEKRAALTNWFLVAAGSLIIIHQAGEYFAT